MLGLRTAAEKYPNKASLGLSPVILSLFWRCFGGIFWKSRISGTGRPSCQGPSSTRQRQDMNVGKSCPLPLCTLIENFCVCLCRTPQLVGNFEALRFIEAEEKRKNKAEKGKRRDKLEKRKTNLQPPFSGCKLWAFVTIKLGKKCQKMHYICP